jgi:hypothetical protein
VSDQSDIPVLTDVIESGIEIKMSELGLDDNPQNEPVDQFNDATEIDIVTSDFGTADPFEDNTELEKVIRQILDEHLELAWQDIKLAIKYHLKKS